MENDRVIIGVGHTAASGLFGGTGDGLRGCLIHQAIHFARFANVPILTKFAGQIATRCAEGKYRRTGQKMVERFFFDRVDAKPAGSTIGKKHHLPARVASHKAQTPLALMQLAKTWANQTFDPAIFKLAPIAGRKNLSGLEVSVH